MAITRRRFLAYGAAVSALGPNVSFGKNVEFKKPARLAILGYGGPFDELTKRYVATPFTKETGIPVTMRGGSSDLTSSLLAQKDDPQYDLVHTGYGPYTFLKEHGVLDRIDPSQIEHFNDLYGISKGDFGVATSLTGVVIVYNTDKIHRPITTWEDLWDPAFKGHVSIERLPAEYGIDTLIMAAKLAGGDEHNINPGFAKLKKLKPNLGAIYTNSSQAQQLFEQGGIWIAPWYGGRVASTQKAGVPVAAATTKEGDPVYRTMLCPLKGRWNPWTAKFMSMHLASVAQMQLAKQFSSGPSRKDVKLPPDVAKNVPYGAEQVSKLLDFDWSTINRERAAWTQRFIQEIAS